MPYKPVSLYIIVLYCWILKEYSIYRSTVTFGLEKTEK